MSTNPHPQRRDFLKTAAAGAAGAMGIGALKFDKLFAQSTGGWVSGMQINPAIDNRRVICCHDTTMLTSTPNPMSFTNQNAAVNATVVASNMDQMAMQLAQKATAADAWSTIFRSGSGKSWGATKVAIKTNGIGSNTTNRQRVAVIKKICDVLIGLGVPAGNIVLYDTCDDASVYYNSYISLTDSTKIRAVMSTRASNLGNFAAVTLTNATAISCPADLVNGVTDILVNISVSKMHNGTGGRYSYGSVTLCMKNHLGTFTDGSKAQHSDNLHNLQALFEINKHSAILGGTPVRQQLCIVDALLSCGASGPGGTADNRTDRLIMGTFAPIVDYLTAKNIILNSAVMTSAPVPAAGITAAATILPQFLTSFGYAETDPEWIECTPPNWPAITGGTGGTSGSGGSGSGGTGASGGARSGGTSGSGGAAGGGTSASGGARSGGTSASGGAPSGGTSGSGGARSGGTSASGGAPSGGASGSGGAASGGVTATGGTPNSGGTASGGAGGTGGPATSSASASGGSATTGGTSAATGTGGSSGTPGSTATGGNSSGGCDIAGVDRRATRWGAMLAFGAVVAEKLRRLVGSDDRSS